MASITSMMNSSYNTSSIYGNRNVLSGLASGMDTETMIENAVSGIKMKIQNLVKKRTKVEWQQEAYRSIIDKAVNLNNKYTSYSSKTNLLSNSFFTNSVITTTKGTYADKLTATGKTSSDIQINAVKQLATAASYTVSGTGTPFGGANGAITGGKFDVTGLTTVNAVSGSLSFQYGGANGATFDIKFDELEDLTEGMKDKTSAEQLAAAIQKKLGEITYSYTKNGVQETTTADKAIKVSVEDGKITFSDGLGEGNQISISDVSGYIGDTLKISKGDTSIKVADGTKLMQEVKTVTYLDDKTLGVTFNGTTKNIDLNKIFDNEDYKKATSSKKNETFKNLLQDQLDDAFGKGKIEVSYSKDGKLSFTPQSEGDTLSLGGSAIEALGFQSGDSNYINTSKTLKELLGDRADEFFNKKNLTEGKDGTATYDFVINGASIKVTEDTTLESLMNSINSNADAGVKVSYSKLTNEFKFTASETGSNSRIEFDKLAKDLFGRSEVKVDTGAGIGDILGEDYKVSGKFSLTLGDDKVEIDSTKNTSIDTIVARLNKEINAKDENGEYKHQGLADRGVEVSFDADTNSLVLKDKDGKNVDFSYGEGVAKDLFNKIDTGYTKGTDAVMDVTINGKRFTDLTRSSNNFDIDGLNITVKDTFNVDGSNKDEDGKTIEPVTFETTTDNDKIVDAIRSFVNDYNEMITELKGAYSTQPLTDSSKNRYEPLTAEQEEKYTESELAAYNEKAKTGILFGDTTLSSMYSKLLSAIAPGGADGQTLREIGIGTSYENGLTTISLDEDKLRAALDSDPEKVKNAFTKSKEGGSSSDGLMQTVQNTLNTYVRTTGEPKGVLINRAGSVKAPTSLNSNTLNSQINNIDNEIDRWQNKMASQIDRYTVQFSRLEQLVAAMNAQSSALAGLMGGYEGY